MTGWVKKRQAGPGQNARDRGQSSSHKLCSCQRQGFDRDRGSDMDKARDRTDRHCSALSSTTETGVPTSLVCMKCVYGMVCGVCVYVAVVLFSESVCGGSVCVCQWSTLPHLLAASRLLGSVGTHSSDFLCDAVISSGREKMRPWRWIGTLKAVVLHRLV